MKLQNLLNPDLELKVENHAVTFTEAQTDKHALREVIVQGLPDQVFVFSTDKRNACTDTLLGKCRNQFLNDQNDRVNKNCDGVIIHYDEHQQLNIVLCELKSTNPQPIQYETQLINTGLLMDYLITLFNLFYKEEGQLNIKNLKYILFYVSKPRPLKVPKNMRSTVEVLQQATPVTERMYHYPENILKYPCPKTMYNYVDWQDLISW
jgi:hypothetical protein